MTLAIIAILIGFLLLMWSADHLVESAALLATNLGLSAFVVGVTVIGFGTSAPELFVSAQAAMGGNGNLAVGNALGSNITNIGLVLGSAVALRPLVVGRKTRLRDLPLLIAVGLIAWLVCFDHQLTRANGAVLAVLLIGILAWSVLHPDTEDAGSETLPTSDLSNWLIALWALAAILGLLVASRILVYGAVELATLMGVSELFIGLTVIAIGTSLPELAASVAAARKGILGMVIGNVFGSNLFNTLGVLGMTGMVRSTQLDAAALDRDFPVMLGFTVILWLLALPAGGMKRWTGVFLLVAYFVYIALLCIQAV